jgi:hypothetical protein
MQALKGKNPLTESFLVQLDVDLEGSGLRVPVHNGGESSVPLRALSGKCTSSAPINPELVECSPLFNIRESREHDRATSGSGPPETSKGTFDTATDFSGMTATQSQSYTGGFPVRSQKYPVAPSLDKILGGASTVYEETSCFMEMDVSFDNTSSPRFPSQSNSGHPTPSISSNNASSQTSFSPAHPDDQPSLTSTSSIAGISPNIISTTAAMPQPSAFPFFDQHLSNNTKAHSPEGASNNFRVPSTWNHADSRLSPSGTGGEFGFAGMASGDISSWESMGMMEGQAALFSGWDMTSQPDVGV